MQLNHPPTFERELDEDPEYTYYENSVEDVFFRSMESLQLLATELSTLKDRQDDERVVLERVYDYVLRDSVYDLSTRACFQSALFALQASTGRGEE